MSERERESERVENEKESCQVNAWADLKYSEIGTDKEIEIKRESECEREKKKIEGERETEKKTNENGNYKCRKDKDEYMKKRKEKRKKKNMDVKDDFIREEKQRQDEIMNGKGFVCKK